MKKVTLVLTIADDMSNRRLEELKAEIYMWYGVAKVDDAPELARLQRIASTAELISLEAELRGSADLARSQIMIGNNLLRDLADALKS